MTDNVMLRGNTPLGLTVGSSSPAMADAGGALIVMDFFAKAVLDGHAFQVRAGTITTPLVGDVVITDTAAEFCVDPPSGMLIMPVSQYVSIRLGGGTLHEYATKSVATASSAGTAFVPLPLLTGSFACSSTARVSAAGGVTVTAELATTTRRHWSFAQPIAMGAYITDSHWDPDRPPVIKSNNTAAYCLYTQIAATTTGPSYYANLDFLEFTNAGMGLS